MMVDRVIDRAYLAYQYGDSEKLRIRLEAHERYSERSDNWADQMVSHLAGPAGRLLLDVGCGYGSYHPTLVRAGFRIVAFDLSAGLIREARQRAVEGRLPVTYIRADTQAIPLAERSCDAVTASHVLFHVPDVALAIREIRRVVRPGGQIYLTANASDHSARLYDLHCQAARELGFTPTAGPAGLPFTLDHLPLVRSVFPNAELHRWPNAFLFPTTDAALRFYASSRVDAIQERRPDRSHQPPLLEKVGAMIDRIIAEEGVFRVPKDAGCFVATV
jgi:SAM-dependent methyltransferase